jgi:hypothetical protein
LNVLIVISVSIGLFVGSLFVLMRIFPDLEPNVGLLYVLLVQTTLSWLVGIVFLSLGSKNLGRIE